MAVSIRLKMLGAKHRPFYLIVALDSRKTRDGRSLAILGHYAPLTEPAGLTMDEDRIMNFLQTGAVPSPTVKNLLRQNGITQVSVCENGKNKKVWRKGS